MSWTIRGAAMSDQGRLESRGHDLVQAAVTEAMDDAGVKPADIEVVVMGNIGGIWDGQGGVVANAWLYPMEYGRATVLTVENACAGGATAIEVGAMALRGGSGPVLVIGAEKMYTTVQSDIWNIDHGDGLMTLMEGGVNQRLREELIEANQNPFNSVFMGINASWARHQIDERGTTEEEAAWVAVKNRGNGAINPKARFSGKPVTFDEVMDSPVIADPLRMAMCSAFSDGVGALVISDDECPDRPKIISTKFLSGDGTMEDHDRMTQLSDDVWEEAGIGPEDVDVIEVHDACAFEELWALEACGFYGVGEAGKATMAGHTGRDGRQPVNAGGGLIGRGHPVSATGVLQVVELYEQLMGRCGDHQVPGDPKIAFAENQGGLSGWADVAAMGMTVLKKD